MVPYHGQQRTRFFRSVNTNRYIGYNTAYRRTGAFDQGVFANASCRTVALWFYILVFDYNATDPVMQKSCNLRAIFCAIWGCISPLSSLVQSYISFTTLL
jgi:hypothetical protein